MSIKKQRGAHKNAKSKAHNAIRRKERREAAEALVKAWRSLSPQEQLKRLPAGGAKRQRARIMAKLEKAA